MAASPVRSAPTHELPVIVTEGSTKSIYCIHVELTQTDLAYQLPAPPQPRAAAPLDIAVYADNVVLASPLVLPGRNLTIVTRTLVLGKGASVDVSGADADKGFVPGDRPQQGDHTPGGPGSAGADATKGGDAGNVTIVAEQVIGQGADVADSGPTVDVVDLPGGLSVALTAALATARPGTLPAFSATTMYVRTPWDSGPQPWPFTRLYGVLDAPAASLRGLDSLRVERVRLEPDGASALVTLSAGQVACDLPTTLQIQALDNPGGHEGTTFPLPFVVGPLAVRVDVTVPLDTGAWTIGEARIAVSLPNGVPVTQTPPAAGGMDAVGRCVSGVPPFTDALTQALTSGITTALTPVVAGAVTALRASLHGDLAPALVVLARGRIGGRGQDGQPGSRAARARTASTATP